MSDDPGLLGNLPRSRPGTRSAKRATGASKPASKPKPKAKAKTAAKPSTPPRAKPANPKPRPVPERRQADPVSETLKVAAKIAGAGARTANGVTREILRRLPRP